MNNMMTLLFDVTAGAGNFNLVAACVWMSLAAFVYVAITEQLAK